MKSGVYTTTGNNQLSGWTRKKTQFFPKPNLHSKKVMVTVGWSAVHLINYSFLNPGEIITSEKYVQQIDEIYWKLQCLQPTLVNRKGAILFFVTMPNHGSHNRCFKSWTNLAVKFCLICHIHLTLCQPTTTSSSISTTCCRENASTTSRIQQIISKSLLNPEAWIQQG